MLYIQENTYSEYTFSGQNTKKNNVLAIYIQKNTIYSNLNRNTPKFWAKYIKRKGIIPYIYKKPPIEKQLYIMNLGKVQKNIYIGNTGARYIRNRYLLYIGILSGENLKRKSVYFLYIRRKKHLQENTQILGKA